MNEDEEKPILKDSDIKKHNKTVVIETHQEIKKVHSHKHSDSSQKKSEEKHHHHHDTKNTHQKILSKRENHQIQSETNERKNKSNHVHFHHQNNETNYSRDKEELQKWKAFGDHIIDMLLIALPKSEIPSIPQVGKMAAIETLCSTVCRLVQNPTQNPKYQELEAKYNKCKTQMKSMRKKCSQLHIEVQRNQQMLYQHMQSIHQKEEDAVEKKLHKLEAILSEQFKIQQIQFANLEEFDYSRSQCSPFHTSKNSPSRVHSQKIIKTKKVVKVANNSINTSNNSSKKNSILDRKDEYEESSESSSEGNENNVSVENDKELMQKTDENKNDIFISEEEEEEVEIEMSTSNSTSPNKQMNQITNPTTFGNS